MNMAWGALYGGLKGGGEGGSVALPGAGDS